MPKRRVSQSRVDFLQAMVEEMPRRALMRVLAHLGENAPGTATVTSARQARFADVCTTIGIQLTDGTEWAWPLAHPGHLVTRIVSESLALQEIFAAAAVRSPCSKTTPWGLAVMFDEFVPGNKLNTQVSRKGMNVCFTFLELGSAGREAHRSSRKRSRGHRRGSRLQRQRHER